MQKLTYNLPISILREGKSFVAYSPALELSTASDTFEGAKTMFIEAANIFFEEISAKGTFEQVLLELGWKKGVNQLMPPIVIASEMHSFSVQAPLRKYARA